MKRRVKQASLVLVFALVAAQFLRPDRANPPVDASHAIGAGTTTGLVAVLDRSCRDCHSNRTVWPWYTQVAPLSWLMAYAVTKGRETINFSEWAGYAPERQQALLALSCADVTNGKMPGAYTLLQPETRLSTQEVATICAAARQAESPAGGVPQ